ncbi:MAG TPA: zinc-binding alcohol dehydrogenase [Planctomycetota bacterium]|nr:zinc-binding alcohol dehydrogenase [Planctomycetota bacterium]
MTTISAAVYELRGPRQLEIRSEPVDPETLGPRDIAARTRISVVSPGTETAAWRGDPPLRPGNVYPRLVGYCNLAEVIAVGSEVRGTSIGDLILTHQPHRSAFRCPAADILTRAPADVPSAEAATTYLFQLGYNALLKGGCKPGTTVGVLGLGVIGLATVALARQLGATVIAYTNQEPAADLARRWGAKAFRKDAAGLEPRAVDLLITTSGSWSDWRLALAQTRKEGTIGVLGFPGRTDGLPTFNPLASEYFYDAQLRIIACGQSPEPEVRRNCEFLLDLIRSRRLPAGDLLENRVPWKGLAAAYDRLSRRETYRTVALDWSLDGP